MRSYLLVLNSSNRQKKKVQRCLMQSLPNYFFELFFGLMWGKSSEVVCIQTFKDSSNKHAMWTKKKWGACKASPSYKQDKHLLEGPPPKKENKKNTHC